LKKKKKKKRERPSEREEKKERTKAGKTLSLVTMHKEKKSEAISPHC